MEEEGRKGLGFYLLSSNFSKFNSISNCSALISKDKNSEIKFDNLLLHLDLLFNKENIIKTKHLPKFDNHSGKSCIEFKFNNKSLCFFVKQGKSKKYFFIYSIKSISPNNFCLKKIKFIKIDLTTTFEFFKEKNETKFNVFSNELQLDFKSIIEFKSEK